MKHNWTYKKLGEVATINYGTRVVQKRDGGTIYPVYGGGDATFRMDTYNRENCLVVARFAMSPKCTRRVVGKFFLNDSGLTLEAKEGVCQDYLDWHIIALNDEIYRIAKGAAQKNLDVKTFTSLSIGVPSLDEQHAIVRELDGINRLIDLQEEQLREYDRLAQSLFYTTFGDPTTNPKGWEIKKLGEISTLLNGRAYSKNELLNKGKYRILRVGNFFTNDSWYYSDLELDADKYCDKGDLLFAWSASFCARIWEGEKVIYHYHIWKVLCDETQLDKVFYCHLLNNMLESMKKDTHGTGMVHLTKIGMEQYYLPLPPLALQQTFAAQIDAIEQQKALIHRSLKDTRTLLAARMQYYFE